MNGFAKLLIKIALWAVEHPETIKELVDAIHAAKQPTPQPVTP